MWCALCLGKFVALSHVEWLGLNFFLNPASLSPATLKPRDARPQFEPQVQPLTGLTPLPTFGAWQSPRRFNSGEDLGGDTLTVLGLEF